MRSTNLLLSISSGLLMCLAFPEIGGWSLVMLVAWVPLLLLENKIETNKEKSIKVFGYSFFTFLIYNIGTTWWIWNADPYGAIMAFVFNAILMAITFQLFHFIKKRVGRREGYIGLLLLWIAFEYTHYHWDLSWPWLNFGNAFANNPALVQWYSYSGVLGGTLWILVTNLIVFSICNNLFIKKEGLGIQTPLFILLVLGIGFPITFSLVQYYNFEEDGDRVNIIVTQPNIDTYEEKWRVPVVKQLEQCFVSTDVDWEEADLILAPETAISESIDEHYLKQYKSYEYLLHKVQNWKNPDLFIGMSSHEFTKNKVPGSRQTKTKNIFENHYNSGLLVNKENRPSISHKSELVLGVEKLPFTSFLPFLEDWALSMGGTSGTLVVPEQLANIRTKEAIIAPAICYESVYGNTCAEFVNKGAEVITIITNDDWWGDTPGHRQHFHFARLRAIENQRYVARSANTGISGFINTRGDILIQSKYKERTALQLKVVKNKKRTFYSDYRDFLGRIFSFVTVLLILFSIVKYLRNRFKAKTDQLKNSQSS